jgi:hypothetical protein
VYLCSEFCLTLEFPLHTEVKQEGEVFSAGSSLSHFSGTTSASAPFSKPSNEASDFSRKELISLLNIPEHLTTDVKNPGIRVYYAKYKACLLAQETLNQMIQNGSWSGKKPSQTQIITLFTCKSMWHGYMAPAFQDINSHPELKDWLENRADGPSDAEVWGRDKGTYSFKDLKEEKNRRQGRTEKGKGKMNEKGKGKDGGMNKQGESSGGKKAKKTK